MRKLNGPIESFDIISKVKTKYGYDAGATTTITGTIQDLGAKNILFLQGEASHMIIVNLVPLNMEADTIDVEQIISKGDQSYKVIQKQKAKRRNKPGSIQLTVKTITKNDSNN